MMKKPILIYALSLLGFALFWAALAALRGDARILPGPGEVLGVLWQEAMSGRLWRHLGMTLWRMAAACPGRIISSSPSARAFPAWTCPGICWNGIRKK